MSETPSRSRMRSGAASSTKRKRGNQSSDISSDNGDASMSEPDSTNSVGASDEEEENEDEEVVIRARQSLRQKSKKRKVAKAIAKSKQSKAVEEESEDESSPDSSPPSSTKGFKVERPSVVFQRRKREVKKQEAKLKAQKRKITSVPLDVSDSSTDSTAEPPSITLTAKKGEAFQEGRNRAGRRVERAMNRSVLNRDQEYPPGRVGEFKRLIPKPQYDEYWSETQQIELEQRLSHDEDFKKQLSVSQFVVGIWKTVYRFTGRLATDIIGPRTGLEFKSHSRREGRLVWTQRLCEALADIVLHPMFELDTEKMALAIQWAVICRTEDRRKYKLSGCSDEPFLRKLLATIEKYQDGSKTPGELREAASYEYMVARGTTTEPPTWSQFMHHIEKTAFKYAKTRPLQSNDHVADVDNSREGAYSVNTTDLYTVRSALDRVKHLSLRKFADSRQVTDAVMPTRSIQDVPNTKLTHEAVKAILLYKERNEQRLRQGGPPEPLPSFPLDLEPPP